MAIIVSISTIVALLVLIYTLIPLVVKFVPSSVSYMVFLNWLCPPSFLIKLHDPAKSFCLPDVSNFYLQNPDGSGSVIGLWRMQAIKKRVVCGRNQVQLDKVILYCHGNSLHRGSRHRLRIYKLFRENGFHVVTFDYRGFGDSKGVVSEAGAVSDIQAVYRYLFQIFPSVSKVIVWGHSLGTSLASKAVRDMPDDLRLPDLLVLESGFNNLREILVNYPLSKGVLALYPGTWMRDMVLKNLKEYNVLLDTENYLRFVRCPVLILHAEDDNRVSFCLGRKLFDNMSSGQSNNICMPPSIRFVRFSCEHRLKHNCIYKHPQTANVFKHFLENNRHMDKFTETSL